MWFFFLFYKIYRNNSRDSKPIELYFLKKNTDSLTLEEIHHHINSDYFRASVIHTTFWIGFSSPLLLFNISCKTPIPKYTPMPPSHSWNNLRAISFVPWGHPGRCLPFGPRWPRPRCLLGLVSHRLPLYPLQDLTLGAQSWSLQGLSRQQEKYLQQRRALSILFYLSIYKIKHKKGESHH